MDDATTLFTEINLFQNYRVDSCNKPEKHQCYLHNDVNFTSKTVTVFRF